MTTEAIPVALSRLFRECSVGAVVLGQTHSMAVQDTSRWYPGAEVPAGRRLRYVEQVRSALGLQADLCLPPEAKLKENGSIAGTWIPAMRFPRWMRCLACGLLHPLARLEPEQQEQCPCGGRLEQLPWVVVHQDGYLTDVPWHDIAHGRSAQREGAPAEAPLPSGSGPQCSPSAAPYLRFSEARSRRTVRCDRCRSAGELPQYLLYPLGATEQPWIRRTPAEIPSEPARLLQVSDVRVHAAITSTALVIPPESRVRKGTIVDRLYGSSDLRRRLDQARTALQRDSILRRTARDWGCAPAQIEAALEELDRGYPLYGGEIPRGRLLESEYKALIEPIPDMREDEDFVTEHHTDAWRALGAALGGEACRVGRAFDRLIEVRRLEEVWVLEGFRRLGDGKVVEPDLTGQAGWLPALALRGEGIFFTVGESPLQAWEAQEQARSRAAKLAKRYLHRTLYSTKDGVEVTPRFLLLHTLAHALVRQLEAEAGYPAASLKERIYCAAGAKPMAGILIYVAVPDEVGSLGGLAERAEPRRFLRLLAAAFEAANWCSLDPVCSQHEGQGPDLLNLAACHACALLPETCCAHGNVLLDRIFVRGDAAAGIRPLLDFVEAAP